MRNLLLYRFLIVNAMAITALAVLYVKGLVAPLFAQDASYITYVIAALFAIVWFWTLKEVVVAASDLNIAADRGSMPAAEADRDKDMEKLAWLHEAAGTMVVLGFLGTLIGLGQAIGEIALVSMGETGKAKTAMGSFAGAMYTAVFTSIVGVVCAIWTRQNLRMLRTALTTYWSNRLLASHNIDALPLD